MTSAQCSPRYPGLRSFKNEHELLYPHRWQRDALIQAVLDPLVTSISPFPVPAAALPSKIDFAFTVRIADVEVSVLITNYAVASGSIGGVEGAYLNIPRRDLLREPLCTAARNVWSRKRFVVSPQDRYHAIALCDGQAPDATMGMLLRELDASFSDPLDQVLALLAQGYLAADLSFGLRRETSIKVGPLAIASHVKRPLDRLKAEAISPKS